MATDILHPDRLGPGSAVGPWTILEVLGAGGMGRVFKAEREGRLYALKMATRLPGQKAPGEEDVDGRCVREASALLQHPAHPNLPHVHAMERWPEPEDGFFYMVTDFIDGHSFHGWRDEAHPTAAQLLDVFLELTRVVAELHKHGIHHRDLHSANILIRRGDDQLFVIDFSSARFPGVKTLTRGLPPVALHVLPPEAVEDAREHGLDGGRFDGGAAGELYALGVLLYEALTDGHPFRPDLQPQALLAAIATVTPRAPHRVNPGVPRSLSAIAMRLLAKHPEDRFASAEALLQALWEANKERASPAWKVPLDLPAEGPAPVTDEELAERQDEEEQARRAARDREQAPTGHASQGELSAPTRRSPDEARGATPGEGASQAQASSAHPSTPRQRSLGPRRAWAACTGGLLLVALLVLVRGWVQPPLAPSPKTTVVPKAVHPEPSALPEVAHAPDSSDTPPGAGALPVRSPASFAPSAPPPTNEADVQMREAQDMPSRKKQPRAPSVTGRALGAAAAACLGFGCTGAQVRPPPPEPLPEECPPGAVKAMEKLGIAIGLTSFALLDTERTGFVTVHEGNFQVELGPRWKKMPASTRLSGQLIFGKRVYGRLTEAQTPDGQRFPVCVELWDEDGGRGLRDREPRRAPGTATVFSTVNLEAVERFK